MFLMRKTVFRVFLTLLLLVAGFLFLAIGAIDVTPLNKIPEVKKTYTSIDSLHLTSGKGGPLRAGWAKVNITPAKPLNMAGYGPRPKFTSVHDSLFARVILLNNGNYSAAIISLDLIMFPKPVRKNLSRALKEAGLPVDFLFLSATHTHSGFGNFDPSPAGELIFGDYDEKNTLFLMEKIVDAVQAAHSRLSPVTIAFQKIDARELVYNRLAPKKGKTDGWLRVIRFRNDHEKQAILISFSGHPVNLTTDVAELSRDYPGVLADNLEKDASVDFAMFTAGMVGSHNIKLDMPKGYEKTTKTGRLLADRIIAKSGNAIFHTGSILRGADIRVLMPPSQMRIAKNLRIRDWLFRKAFGPLEADVLALRIGDILLLGMPCDFSGELSVNNLLDRYAGNYGKKLFITSFNGNYIGYITEDAHYLDSDHDEVRIMNWVGPYKGEYFTTVTKKLIERFGEGDQPAASETISSSAK